MSPLPPDENVGTAKSELKLVVLAPVLSSDVTVQSRIAPVRTVVVWLESPTQLMVDIDVALPTTLSVIPERALPVAVDSDTAKDDAGVAGAVKVNTYVAPEVVVLVKAVKPLTAALNDGVPKSDASAVVMPLASITLTLH